MAGSEGWDSAFSPKLDARTLDQFRVTGFKSTCSFKDTILLNVAILKNIFNDKFAKKTM